MIFPPVHETCNESSDLEYYYLLSGGYPVVGLVDIGLGSFFIISLKYLFFGVSFKYQLQVLTCQYLLSFTFIPQSSVTVSPLSECIRTAGACNQTFWLSII